LDEADAHEYCNSRDYRIPYRQAHCLESFHKHHQTTPFAHGLQDHEHLFFSHLSQRFDPSVILREITEELNNP
jgi:adenosylcobinamide amidohydrolase